MSARRRAGPSDPMTISRRRAAERQGERGDQTDPAAWGFNREALAMDSHLDVAVRADAAGRPVRARRQDVFDRLAARGRLEGRAVDAVRRLQGDIAILHRTATGGADFAPRVDRPINPAGFSDARRGAGERIEAVLSLTGPASARLLTALCEPAVALGRSCHWREVVRQVTGEGLADAQGAILRMACDNLAGAYAALDRRKLGRT